MQPPVPSPHTAAVALHKIIPPLSLKADASLERAKEVLNVLIPGPSLQNGPLPTEESTKAMLRTIHGYIEEDMPIPILIAAAACKLPLSGHSVDVAEVIFIKMLIDLQIQVQTYYPIGLSIRIRLEDGVTMVLFPREGLETMLASYVSEFRRVIETLNAASFITLVCETDVMPVHVYMPIVFKFSPLFIEHFKTSDNFLEGGEDEESKQKRISSLEELQSYGWGEPVSKNEREIWKSRYASHFPNKTEESYVEGMSLYYANILARRYLKGSGTLPSWKHGHLEIALRPPPEGSPVKQNRLYYRSAKKENIKSSLPFWQLVGISVRDKNGSLQLSAVSFKNKKVQGATRDTIQFGSKKLGISYSVIEPNPEASPEAKEKKHLAADA